LDDARPMFRSSRVLADRMEAPMFHSNNPTLFGRPSDIVTGTLTLRSTIAKMRALSRSLASDVPHEAAEVRELLSGFAEQLSVYFDAEEAGSYYGTILVGHPGPEGKAAGLERGHDVLRDLVASVRRFARDGGESRELGRRIDLVVDDFERQEHEENDLLQEFFLRDEGRAG
jgi:hypothetical protein